VEELSERERERRTGRQQIQFCGRYLNSKFPEYAAVVPTTEDEILKGNNDYEG
jgi:hypothetical protein